MDALPYTEFAINSTVSQSTGFAPFELLYGQNVPLPLDHAIANPNASKLTDAHSIISKIHKMVQNAKHAMQKA